MSIQLNNFEQIKQLAKSHSLYSSFSQWIDTELESLKNDDDVCEYLMHLRRNDIKISNDNNSMVSYILGITNSDAPTERVRMSFPVLDIDTDYAIDRRDEVIKYLEDKYGSDCVSHVVTFTTFRIKKAIQELGRVLGMKPDLRKEISDTVPFKYKNLDDAIDKSPELKEYSVKYKKLFALIRRLEDIKKDKSCHASAVIISDKPFKDGVIPMMWDARNKRLITGFDMYTTEKLGLVKVDVLGLKTLSVLNEVERLVNERKRRNLTT